jgi:hypothetical protein
MHKLYKEIRDIIEDHDYLTANSISEYIGCTKQEFSKFLGGGGIGFRKLLRLSYLLFPENQKDVMDEWCLRLNTTESIKQSFEYASITRNKQLLKALIDKYKTDGGSISKYVSIYSILYRYYIYEIDAGSVIEELRKVGLLKDELCILAEIMKCYNYYFLGKYHLMLETSEQIMVLINELGDRHIFFKETYLHRISEVLMHVSLHLNDIESARYYASIIINANICAKTVAAAYDIMGMSFLSEDRQKSIQYLQKRYDISQTLREPAIEQNARRELDFAKLYLNLQLEDDSDPILLRIQNSKGSEFELKLIKEARFQQGDDDFLVLISAIAKNSISKLHECRKLFFKEGKYFFASLAALEVKKLGESEWIDEFMNFKIETKGDVNFEKDFIKCFSIFGDYRSYISA